MMDGLVRFSDYDVFGYLASGLVALGVYDVAFGTHLVVDANWSVTHGAFVIIAAYVAGHAVAAFATPIFDRWIVRKGLGRPSDNLMRKPPEPEHNSKRCLNLRWMMGDYFDPLRAEVRAQVLKRAGIDQADDDPHLGERVFWKAWPQLKRDPVPYARMDAFLRLYGFCRNMSFVCLVGAIVFIFRPPQSSYMAGPWYAPALLMCLLSIILFKRYLKFFRAYGLELLTSYAEPGETK